MKKINLRNLQKMIDDKFISVQKHPTMDLWIYNYTQKAQFAKLWNNETLSCRGLIMDGLHKIIARPFRKFFNLEEIEEQGRQKHGISQLPLEGFEIFEKLDGSLGILYHDEQGIPALATRGSFTSDQAIKGTDILHKIYKEHKDKDLNLEKSYTYLFEIIYPQNRIVVDYGKKEDIFLLTVVNTYTGTEMPYEKIKNLYQDIFSIVKRYDGVTDYRDFIKQQRENSEGYVIRFPNNYRVKVKFEEYKRLHKLVTGVNARTIWEALRAGESIESMCYRVPDEFYHWIQKAAQILKEEYRDLESDALNAFADVEGKGFTTRKEKAIEYQKYPELKGLMFMILDGKDYRDEIWQLIRPAAEKPFSQQSEDI